MDKNAWENFLQTRKRFSRAIKELEKQLPGLKDIQQGFADSRGEGSASSYTVDTPVVYNTALDDITAADNIKLILVGDNPGRREQAKENIRYLVGPSGKIAGKFFRDNPALGIDFTKNVIILNKTPIHSPRTNELKQLVRLYDKSANSLAAALEESQKTMASLLLEFQQALGAQVWITGYSEMKKSGIFESYTEELRKLYAQKPKLYNQLYIFRHFSMNQFTIDLKQQSLTGETVKKTLERIGAGYRQRILGIGI
ncbi:MAG: hypothetical protein LBU66_08715 [Treponema sp.]|jgi:hypothetical protein|nr:hypothetical protein [Treponema sp.]